MIKITSVFIIFSLCISGYLYLSNMPRYRHAFVRTNGYHTFLQSAGVGIILAKLAILIYVFLPSVISCLSWNFSIGDWFLNRLLLSNAEHSYVVLFDIASISLLISLFVTFSINVLFKDTFKAAHIEFFARDSESPEYTQLLFNSYEYGLPILFTMSDNKIYIGYPVEIHAKDFNDIHIIPLYSGYRNKDDLTSILITPYSDVLKDVEDKDEEALDFKAFSVCLPVREIVYAHLHDFRYEKDFKKREKELKEANKESTGWLGKLLK